MGGKERRKMQRKILISEICSALKLPYVGPDKEINGMNLCNRTGVWNCTLSYVVNSNYIDIISKNKNIQGVVLAEEEIAVYKKIDRELTYIPCKNPEETFYDIHDYLYERTDFYDKFYFPKKVGEGSDIHPSAVIEDGVFIGKNVRIGANTVVRKSSVIKDGCTIGCNTTIGSEGFQVLRINNRNRKIVHCGGVLLENHVCVGDGVTICNSLFEGATEIGENTKIDNMTYVGHNVLIGRDTVITAGVILCGSSIVEKDAWIGVNSSVLNRVVVGEGAKIGMGSVVTRDIAKQTLAFGVPAKAKSIL